MTDTAQLLRILAFRQLATHFLESTNPRLERHIVILECILSYDGPIPDAQLRYFAYNFFRTAEQAIENGWPTPQQQKEGDPASAWIYTWRDNYCSHLLNP